MLTLANAKSNSNFVAMCLELQIFVMYSIRMTKTYTCLNVGGQVEEEGVSDRNTFKTNQREEAIVH